MPSGFMKVLDGEKVLLESRDLLLTTHRVRHHESGSHFTSIMLEQVCSVECGHRPFLWVLFLAVVFLAVASVMGYYELNTRDNSAWAVFGVAVLFLVAYFFVRAKSVVIRSAGATIKCPLGMLGSASRVYDFADALEAAKHERLKVQCAEMAKRNGLTTEV